MEKPEKRREGWPILESASLLDLRQNVTKKIVVIKGRAHLSDCFLGLDLSFELNTDLGSGCPGLNTLRKSDQLT